MASRSAANAVRRSRRSRPHPRDVEAVGAGAAAPPYPSPSSSGPAQPSLNGSRHTPGSSRPSLPASRASRSSPRGGTHRAMSSPASAFRRARLAYLCTELRSRAGTLAPGLRRLAQALRQRRVAIVAGAHRSHPRPRRSGAVAVDLVNFVLLLRDCSHDRRPALLEGETLSRQVPHCLGARPRRSRRRPSRPRTAPPLGGATRLLSSAAAMLRPTERS